MSTPYPPAPRRLMRDPNRKLVGGVCSGLAKYLNMDVNLVRILAVVITLFTGIPIVLYLIALFVLPEEGDDPAAAAVRERSSAERLRRRVPRSLDPAAVRGPGPAAGGPRLGSGWCTVGAAAAAAADRSSADRLRHRAGRPGAVVDGAGALVDGAGALLDGAGRGQEGLTRTRRRPPAHSHSMVPGGLLVMSTTTRFTSRTSLVIRVLIRSSRS